VSPLIRGALFDYGETLVKSVKPWEKIRPTVILSVYRVLRSEGMDLSYDQFAVFHESFFAEFAARESMVNRDFPDSIRYTQLVAKAFPRKSNIWRKAVAYKAKDAFWRAILKNYTMQEDAHRCLDELREMGIKMAIVSNHHNPEALTSHLRELGILDYFSPVIASAQLRFRKPDPRIFLKCLSTMRIRPREAVFVGDSFENDVVGAKKVGIVSILLINENGMEHPLQNRIEPDHVAKNLMEIPGIVSSV
jgi:HAD superfamily hydrolase (TIGR01509 family)